jgi:hypothetical protein
MLTCLHCALAGGKIFVQRHDLEGGRFQRTRIHPGRIG